jgi:hypothetical protein
MKLFTILVTMGTAAFGFLALSLVMFVRAPLPSQHMGTQAGGQRAEKPRRRSR